MRRTYAFLLLAAIIALTGCSSNDQPDTMEPAPAPTATAPSATAEPTATPTAAAPTTAAPPTSAPATTSTTIPTDPTCAELLAATQPDQKTMTIDWLQDQDINNPDSELVQLTLDTLITTCGTIAAPDDPISNYTPGN